jgi:hypothetical protein
MSLVWQISCNEILELDKHFARKYNTSFLFEGVFEYLKQSKIISIEIKIHYQQCLGKWNGDFGIYVIIISEDTHFLLK